jgi:hypothetical protein
VRVALLVRDTAPVVVSVVMALVRDALAESVAAPILVVMAFVVSVVPEARETAPSVERMPAVVKVGVAARVTAPLVVRMPAVDRDALAASVVAPE